MIHNKQDVKAESKCAIVTFSDRITIKMVQMYKKEHARKIVVSLLKAKTPNEPHNRK